MTLLITARQVRIVAAAVVAPAPSVAQSSMGSRDVQAADLDKLSPTLRAEVPNRGIAGSRRPARRTTR